MSLGDVIDDFETGTYTLLRAVPDVWERGRAVPQAPTELVSHGSLQPLTGRELMRLPEGMRTRERRVYFTKDRIVGSPTPDRLREENGDTWEAESVEDHSVLGGFYRVTFVREGE